MQSHGKNLQHTRFPTSHSHCRSGHPARPRAVRLLRRWRPANAARAVVCSAFLMLAACSGETRYNLRLDGLSFIPAAERAHQKELPEHFGNGEELLELHLLPYLPPEIYNDGDSDAAPEALLEAQRGARVEIPFADPPEDVELRLRLDAVVDLTNESGFDLKYELEVYIAPAAAENVFTDPDAKQIDEVTVTLGSNNGPTATTLTAHPEITQNDPAYDILKEGEFRVGVRLRVKPADSGGSSQAAAAISSQNAARVVGYEVRALMLEVSGRPFGFIT